MNEIELNAVPVTNEASPLQPEDITYCEQLFSAYTQHYQFLSGLDDTVYCQLNLHLVKFPSVQPFDGEFDKIRDARDEIHKVMTLLSVKFAEKIERYFTQVYNIIFTPLPLKKDRSIISFTSYQPLIDNIVNQIGNDFAAAGKEQIKDRFKRGFHWEQSQPVLKGDKISFPSLASYDIDNYSNAARLDYADETPKLLDAITLFFWNRTKRLEGFESQLQEWRNSLQFPVWYLLSGEMDISIRFYKNRKVDLQFKNAQTALDFWNTFELENIALVSRMQRDNQ